VPGGDDRPEGVPEQREPLELEGVREPVDVLREDLEAERARIDPPAPTLPTLVDVEETELGAERVQPGPEVRVVEARPTVEDDQRQPVAAEVVDEERVAVEEPDVQLFASCQSSPTPMSTASGGSRS
jgi:hypothetical protein